jgi:hypothetical protein
VSATDLLVPPPPLTPDAKGTDTSIIVADRVRIDHLFERTAVASDTRCLVRPGCTLQTCRARGVVRQRRARLAGGFTSRRSGMALVC